MQEITLYQIFDWFEKRNIELPIVQYKNTILESNLNFSLNEAYRRSLFGFEDKGDDIYRNLKILSIFATRLLLIYQEAKDRGLYNNIGDRDTNEAFNEFIAKYDLLSILECLKCKKLDERQTKWLIKELGLEPRIIGDCSTYYVGNAIGISSLGIECGIVKPKCEKFVICNQNIATIDIKFLTVKTGEKIKLIGTGIEPLVLELLSNNVVQESNRFANFINSSYSTIMANTNNNGVITLLFDKSKWKEEELCTKEVYVEILPDNDNSYPLTTSIYYSTGIILVCCIPDCASCCEEAPKNCGAVIMDNTKAIVNIDSTDLADCNPCCSCDTNYADGCSIIALIKERIDSKNITAGNSQFYLWKEPINVEVVGADISHTTINLLNLLGLSDIVYDTDCYQVQLYLIDYYTDTEFTYIRGVSYAVVSKMECTPSFGGVTFLRK